MAEDEESGNKKTGKKEEKKRKRETIPSKFCSLAIFFSRKEKEWIPITLDRQTAKP